MKEVKKTVYVAADGLEFVTAEGCKEYELFLARKTEQGLSDLIRDYNVICCKLLRYKHPYRMLGSTKMGHFAEAEENLKKAKIALKNARQSCLLPRLKRRDLRAKFNLYCEALETLDGLRENYFMLFKRRYQVKHKILNLRKAMGFVRKPNEGI